MSISKKQTDPTKTEMSSHCRQHDGPDDHNQGLLHRGGDAGHPRPIRPKQVTSDLQQCSDPEPGAAGSHLRRGEMRARGPRSPHDTEGAAASPPFLSGLAEMSGGRCVHGKLHSQVRGQRLLRRKTQVSWCALLRPRVRPLHSWEGFDVADVC